MPTNFRLITIPISHYSEKVRWALEYLQIPFQELPHMPPFHRRATKKYDGTSVPVLVTKTKAIESYREIGRVFDRVSQILGDGRKYLLGDRFSAIDLTFAALAAPILQPPEHHISPTPIAELPSQMQTDIRNCQATSAGEFGLRLYREDRRA